MLNSPFSHGFDTQYSLQCDIVDPYACGIKTGLHCFQKLKIGMNIFIHMHNDDLCEFIKVSSVILSISQYSSFEIYCSKFSLEFELEIC
jgi:hypothetical protein